MPAAPTRAWACLRGGAHLVALAALVRVLGAWPSVAGRTLGPWLGERSLVYAGLPVLAALALGPRLRWLGAVAAAGIPLLAAEPLALRRQVLLALALAGYVVGADRLLQRLDGSLRGQLARPGAARRWAAALAWCVLALATGWMAVRGSAAPALEALDARGRGNLVLITLDTFRADALGWAGATYGDTPHLDGFLAQATRIGHAVAPAPHTHPSMATILTGLEPRDHGSVVGRPHLAREAATLPEHLQRCGYRTAGFFENPWMTREFGFDQGFGRFVGGVSGLDPTIEAVEWLQTEGARAQAAGERFYCHVHLFGAHGPYEPRSPWIDRSSPGYEGPLVRISNEELQAAELPGAVEYSYEDRLRIIALYASEVSAVDAEVGLLLATLTELELERDTLVVITADHGEEFFDHGGLHHGHTLHAELLEVPWFLRWPGELPKAHTVGGAIGLVDLAPTVLDLLGLPALVSPARGGQSRLPWILGERHRDSLPPVHSTRYLLRGRHLSAYLRYPWKLVVSWSVDPEAPWRAFDSDQDVGFRAELYHLPDDSTEQVDLASQQPEVLDSLVQEWRASQVRQPWGPSADPSHGPAMSAEQLEALQGMGYAGALEEWRAAQER